ncbi:ras-related protein Rab-13 [Halyomorpha halys]|uniref:ras-related protein Rab-13 n=1 Tax=Halyomorpha halys TaxID=286706 RepID=UPI0006D51FDE|nr:ras-related protein Rab-13-like [Halyomorpha halys]
MPRSRLSFKILVVGDCGVGKSCIVNKVLQNSFRPSYIPTLGMDLFKKKIEVQGRKAELCIWDCSGREIFKSVRSPYYGNAVGVLLVYDITTYRSFENIIKWYIKISVDVHPSAVLMLVGNKSDLNIKREVMDKRAKNLAKLYGFVFMETSALQYINIEEVFQILASEIYNRNLGRIYLLENQSRQIKNESHLLNVKKEPNRPQERKKECCEGMCFPWRLNWRWLMRSRSN